MKKPFLLLPLLFLLLLGLLIWHPWRRDSPNPQVTTSAPPPSPSEAIPPAAAPPSLEPVYETKPASHDGIGKFYMGREISQVMGHEGIDWLERDNREAEEAPSEAIAALDLKPDAIIADIGAGSGYYTFRIAELVPDGQVIAVDIQPEMLAFIDAQEEELGLDNVTAHLGSVDDTQLDPESIDAALMVDAYHEFSHPREIMTSIVSALRPGGKVFLLEYRAEDPSVPIKGLHKMTQAQAIKEMEAVGLAWETTHDFLPWQHLMVFTKP
ncbi:class I SAM-dependent methyltransferase [Haloferula chungangensis]|uniref:Class I SAM-dependent methyltransferase n=1 Tax=Haloferula chungangensis TaxID=1048331 RepID=A0ABW2L2M2_9BACT